MVSRHNARVPHYAISWSCIRKVTPSIDCCLKVSCAVKPQHIVSVTGEKKDTPGRPCFPLNGQLEAGPVEVFWEYGFSSFGEELVFRSCAYFTADSTGIEMLMTHARTSPNVTKGFLFITFTFWVFFYSGDPFLVPGTARGSLPSPDLRQRAGVIF